MPPGMQLHCSMGDTLILTKFALKVIDLDDRASELRSIFIALARSTSVLHMLDGGKATLKYRVTPHAFVALHQLMHPRQHLVFFSEMNFHLFFSIKHLITERTRHIRNTVNDRCSKSRMSRKNSVFRRYCYERLVHWGQSDLWIHERKALGKGRVASIEEVHVSPVQILKKGCVRIAKRERNKVVAELQ